MGKRKCSLCGEYINSNEETVTFKNSKVHKTCFSAIVNQKQKDENAQTCSSEHKKKEQKENKDVGKIKLAVSEEEYQDKKKVLEYLEHLTKTKPTVKVYKLLEDYIKKYSFTFDGIYKSLYYYYEVLGNEIYGDCIGIVPYVYDDAILYINNLEEVEKKNDAISKEEFQEMYPEVMRVYKRKSREIKEIDIGGIQC